MKAPVFAGAFFSGKKKLKKKFNRVIAFQKRRMEKLLTKKGL